MVTEQVSKLGEQIHNIIESLDRLTVKLSPVLSIEPPSDPSGVSKNPLDVPLAQVLSVCVNDLHDIYLRLDTLKSRIEVWFIRCVLASWSWDTPINNITQPSMKTHILDFICIICTCLVILAFGGLIGFGSAYRQLQLEAIQANAGEFYITKDGKKEFRFISAHTDIYKK